MLLLCLILVYICTMIYGGGWQVLFEDRHKHGLEVGDVFEAYTFQKRSRISDQYSAPQPLVLLGK